jgi:hypothetical protein
MYFPLLGPGAYNIRNLSPSKSASITARPKVSQQTVSFPGPGHYSDSSSIISSKPPSYTMRGRPTSPSRTFVTPGPGAYENRNLSPSKSASMKSRHAMNPGAQTPGPGAYQLSSTFSGPSFTMRPRTKLPKGDD